MGILLNLFGFYGRQNTKKIAQEVHYKVTELPFRGWFARPPFLDKLPFVLSRAMLSADDGF